MNITTGEELAWQERKAASFAFTPLYSGYTVGWTEWRKNLSFNGFVPTSALYPGGPNVATAVAASGAALSPNWGYHTKPATAFLMTMFDVRLGLWVPNPRRSPAAGKRVDAPAGGGTPCLSRLCPIQAAERTDGQRRRYLEVCVPDGWRTLRQHGSVRVGQAALLPHRHLRCGRGWQLQLRGDRRGHPQVPHRLWCSHRSRSIGNIAQHGKQAEPGTHCARNHHLSGNFAGRGRGSDLHQSLAHAQGARLGSASSER